MEILPPQVFDALGMGTRFSQYPLNRRRWVSRAISRTILEVQNPPHNLVVPEFKLGVLTQFEGDITRIAATTREVRSEIGETQRFLEYNTRYIASLLRRVAPGLAGTVALLRLRDTTAHELFHLHQMVFTPKEYEAELERLYAQGGNFLDKYFSSEYEEKANRFAASYVEQKYTRTVIGLARGLEEPRDY